MTRTQKIQASGWINSAGQSLLIMAFALLSACSDSGSDESEADGSGTPPTSNMRDVLIVGNNWDGTADILAVPGYERLKRVNVVPDLDERMGEILSNPVRLVYFLAIRQLIGEGNDQLVDDMFASKDGRLSLIHISEPTRPY